MLVNNHWYPTNCTIQPLPLMWNFFFQTFRQEFKGCHEKININQPSTCTQRITTVCLGPKRIKEKHTQKTNFFQAKVLLSTQHHPLKQQLFGLCTWLHDNGYVTSLPRCHIQENVSVSADPDEFLTWMGAFCRICFLFTPSPVSTVENIHLFEIVSQQ